MMEFSIKKALSTAILLNLGLVLSGCGGDGKKVVPLPDNQPPVVVVEQPLQTVEASQQEVTLSVNVTDDNDNTLSYLWVQTAGVTVELLDSDKSAARFASPVITFAQGNQELAFKLTATDSQGAQSSAEMMVVIEPNNHIPTLSPNIPQFAQVGETVLLESNGQDIDGEIVSYLWQRVSGPQVTIEQANSAVAQFIAPEIRLDEPLVIQLTAFDDKQSSVEHQAIITIGGVNVAPVLVVTQTQIADEQSQITLSVDATDDLAISSYQWVQTGGVEVELNNANAAQASFLAPIVLVNEGDQELAFKVTVTDSDAAFSTADVNVTINPVNSNPVADAMERQFKVAGESVTLSVAASDEDGSIVQYHWQQTLGTSVALNADNLSAISFTAPADVKERLTFTVTATDNEMAFVSQSVDIFTTNDSENKNFVVTESKVEADSGGSTKISWHMVNPDTPLPQTVDVVTASLVQTGAKPLSFEIVDNRIAFIDAPVVDVGKMAYQFVLTLTADSGEQATAPIELNVNAVESHFAMRELLEEAELDYRYSWASNATDVNGDGFTDLVGYDSTYERWQWHKNLAGTGLLRTPEPLMVGGESWKTNNTTLMFIDIDRDGHKDFLYTLVDTESNSSLMLSLKEGQGFASPVVVASDSTFLNANLVKLFVNPNTDEVDLYVSSQGVGIRQLTAFTYRDGAFVQTSRFEHDELKFESDKMQQCDLNNDGVQERYFSRYNQSGDFDPDKKMNQLFVLTSADDYKNALMVHQSEVNIMEFVCYDNRMLLVENIDNDSAQYNELVFDAADALYTTSPLDNLGLRRPYGKMATRDVNQDGFTDIIGIGPFDNHVAAVWLADPAQSLTFTKYDIEDESCLLDWFTEAQEDRLICTKGGKLSVSKSDILDPEKAQVFLTTGGKKITDVSVKDHLLFISHIDGDGIKHKSIKHMENGQLETDFELDQVSRTSDLFFLDHNKDGMNDVIYLTKDEAVIQFRVELQLNTGSGYAEPQTLLTFNEEDLIPYAGSNDRYTPYLTAVTDINSDNVPELGVMLLDSGFEGDYKLFGYDAAADKYLSWDQFGYGMRELYTDSHYYADLTGNGIEDVIWLDRQGSGCLYTRMGCGDLYYREVAQIQDAPEWQLLAKRISSESYESIHIWDENEDGISSMFTNQENDDGHITSRFEFNKEGKLVAHRMKQRLEFRARLSSGGPHYYVDTHEQGKLLIYRYEDQLNRFVTHLQRPMPVIGEISPERFRLMFDIDSDGDDDLITWDRGGVYWYQNTGAAQ
jgi:hypothetical protein